MRQIRKIITKSLVFTGLFLFGLNQLTAQEMPLPDFLNVPAYYMEGSNELRNFTKENYQILNGVKVWCRFQGKESKVRLKQPDNYIFIIRAGNFDPSTKMQLRKMDVTKKYRQFVMLQTGLNVDLNKNVIQYNLKNLGNNVFQIVLESPLEPGEYIFFVDGLAYTFGVE